MVIDLVAFVIPTPVAIVIYLTRTPSGELGCNFTRNNLLGASALSDIVSDDSCSLSAIPICRCRELLTVIYMSSEEGGVGGPMPRGTNARQGERQSCALECP